MEDAPDRFARARRRMVKRQLAARGIGDRRVLDAMGRVPRELFLPQGARTRAYCDGAQSIGCGQTISQPYIVALMTQALHLTGDERVLEVGTGSGYQAAVLAELVHHVYTVERMPELSHRAEQILRDGLGYANISFRVGDGTLGWPEHGPFDRFVVTAAAPALPEALVEQLAPEGEGVAPVGGRRHQVLTHYRKSPDGEVESEELCGCVFVRLVGKDAW